MGIKTTITTSAGEKYNNLLEKVKALRLCRENYIEE